MARTTLALCFSSVVILTCALVLGCSGSQTTETPPPVEEPPPPPPEPQAEPRVWENQESYTVGWPIPVKVGVLNTGEVVVNAPEGEHLGVKLRARRGEEEVTCRAIPQGTPRGGLFPLANGSSSTRYVGVDELCDMTTTGEYVVEVTVEVPTVEGSDVQGALDPVSFTTTLTAPEQPLVARMTAPSSEPFVAGTPVEATVRVTNFGADPVRVAAASRLQVTLTAESGGETVPCEPPARSRGTGRGNLAQGEARELTVDLAGRCQMTIPGTYVITPQVVVPRAGATSFSGTLNAAPLEIEIVAGEEPAPEM